MPTGYTYEVQEGRVTDLASFAIGCARGMGALVMLRDRPAGEPIPDILPTSGDGYATSAEESKARLRELEAMTPDEIAQAAAEANALALSRHAERRERRATERARYEAMIAKVEAWEPPTDEHVGFKEFMLDQLRKSLDFDAPEEHYDAPPKNQPPAAWHSAEIAQAHRVIALHVEQAEKARERDAGRQAWWDALRASLPSGQKPGLDS